MFTDSVAEPEIRVNPFDDGALYNSPTPLATSTAKKKLNTLPCTSYTQAAASKTSSSGMDQLLVDRIPDMALADQSTGSIFKHPGIYLPGRANARHHSETKQQQKSSGRIENLPAVHESTKLDMSERSIASNASSMGLLPDDLLDNEPGEMLVARESGHFTKSIEQSHSADLSDIEQARRCPADDSYKAGILGNSHFASAHAFLQLQGIKTGISANMTQPRIVLGEDEVCKLDKDFGLDGEDTLMFDGPVTKPSFIAPAPVTDTPVRLALNDVDTKATRLIETTGVKQLEELSFCSSLGVSAYNNQSFSLEKMLRADRPEVEEKSLIEELPQGNEHEVEWGKSITFSCDPLAENNPAETSRLYDEDPFQTELAYRTDFDADFANIQTDGLPCDFVSFASAAAKLDADEAEFFGENANLDFDDVLQVPLAHDVSNWSYRSHISFSTTADHDRMSLGTYMQTRSESIKNPNQSLFNCTQTVPEMPILEELEEEDDDTIHDMVAGNPENKEDSQRGSPPPVLTQSIISNSLIANILDMASMSMSNDEIADRFVAQLDKRQRSRSGPKRDIPSLQRHTQVPTPHQPDTSQSVVSQANRQSPRASDNISMASYSGTVKSSSAMSTPCSTHTLTDQSHRSLPEPESPVRSGMQDQSYHSPEATKSNQLPSPEGVKFRTPRESMYVPRILEKRRNIPDESKLNCHLKFDDEATESANVEKGMNKKSPTVASHPTNTGTVASQDLENMSTFSMKSAKDVACVLSNVNKEKDKVRELGGANMSLADLSAILSTRMNVTDARKIQSILMNRNPEGEDIDESSPWQTIMEEPHGQTQINFNVFTSTLLEDEGPAEGVEGGIHDILASVGALKRTPKLEVDRMVKIPDCTIGISEKALVTIRNMADRWLECHIDLLHLFVNGREVSTRTYNPFHMKEKLVLAPMATQKLEVVFFPEDPGSYMAEVRVSSSTQSVSPNQKTPDDDHMTCYVKLNGFADLPSIHFSPKELDFGQQSWGSTGCLPITVANKSMAKVPLRLVITSQSSNVFRWGHKTLPDVPGSESKYTVVSDNICCLTIPGAQAGCALDMTSLDIICDLIKKCALKDPNKSTSLIGVIEIQLDVPSTQPPIGIIQLVVMAGTAKLHVSNGADLIVMETSISKPANRTVCLRNAGTLDLRVALDISRHEQVFTLDSGYLKIPVGEKADVNIAFHPQDDTVKSYNVEMMMFMEPSGPVFGIPVQGKVLAKSRSHPRQHRWLLADLSHINFAGVPLGQPKEITLRLKNSSSSIAKIELIMRSEAKVFKFSTLLNSFTRLSDSKSVVIQPNEVYPVTIAFNPTRSSVFNGKINIKSSDDSTRFVIPLLGYGGLSETFLAEPRSGVLKITPADATDTSSQTTNFTLRNSGIRDAFFSVQIYEDSDKSILVNKEAFAIHPQNGILKSLEKMTVTMLCNKVASSCLPVHIAIYHGDEEARQQMKRALKKFANQRGKWKWSEWFDTKFTNEEETQNCDPTLSQRGDLKIFFDHLSTLELKVELSKKSPNNRWSCRKQKTDLISNSKQAPVIKENQETRRPSLKPAKEMVKKDPKLQKHLPDGEIDKENLPNPKVGRGSQLSSEADKMGVKYSQPNEVTSSDPQKIWRIVPEHLTFVSKDPQSFSIINFGEKSLNFQLSWATDRMSVCNSVLTINPHGVSEISVSPFPGESWEGSIYITAESVMQKIAIIYKGHPDNTNRQPLQSKPDPSNYLQNTNTVTSHETETLEQNSKSNQPFYPSQSGHKQPRHSSGYNKLTPTQQPLNPAVRDTDRDTIELSPIDHSKKPTSPEAIRNTPPFDLWEEEESVDVQMTSEIVQFHVESGCDLVNNYIEFTNFGKTSVNWALNNQSSFPYFSSDNGKRTVMRSYEIFKIFQTGGTLSAGQTCQVHVLFYPEMLFDKKFVCYHACELICQQTNTSSQQPIVIPFLLQGFLTTDRCSLASLMSDTRSSVSSITSSVASSTGSNPATSCFSQDQKLILRPNVVTFQPCPLGKQQQIKVEIKNRNTEPVKITVEVCDGDVFSVSVKSFMINPKKLVKIPIAFKPILKGFINSKIIFSSGADSLTLKLFGVCV